jgi:hypothetical protein
MALLIACIHRATCPACARVTSSTENAMMGYQIKNLSKVVDLTQGMINI